MEIRAEVGLLSRNILFVGKGDPTWNHEIPECPGGFDPGKIIHYNFLWTLLCNQHFFKNYECICLGFSIELIIIELSIN